MTPEERARQFVEWMKGKDMSARSLATGIELCITAALQEEREACLHLVETVTVWNTGPAVDSQHDGTANARRAIAAAIRARGISEKPIS